MASDKVKNTLSGRVAVMGLTEGLSESLHLARFEHRGLSDRTIVALVQAGLDAPERLLFMSRSSIRRLKGIGDVSSREIAEYQRQYSTDVPSA